MPAHPSPPASDAPAPPSATAAGPVTSTRKTTTPARVGLVLAALLAIGDVIVGVAQLDPDQTIPGSISLLIIAAGAATLVAIPFSWRGAGWATGLVIATRLLSALSALPAFVVPGVPAGFVVGAATGMALAGLVTVLLLVRTKRASS